jgi:hypothetical protein
VGTGRLGLLAYGVLPQVLPQLVTFLLYRWEVIVRSSIVVGFITGAGLGYQLRLDLSFRRWTDVAHASDPSTPPPRDPTPRPAAAQLDGRGQEESRAVTRSSPARRRRPERCDWIFPLLGAVRWFNVLVGAVRRLRR